MFKEFENLSLYIFKPVLVTMADGTSHRGQMAGYDADSITLVPEADGDFSDLSLPTAKVADIEYIGPVKDYHSIRLYGELGAQGDIRFLPDELVPGTNGRYLFYWGYETVAAGHLYIRDSEPGIPYVRDLRIISHQHVVHRGTLQKCQHIYLYQDGHMAVGTLVVRENDLFLAADNGLEEPFCAENIENIMPRPNAGEFVTLILADGTSVSGVCSGMLRGLIALHTDAGVKTAMLSKVVRIRYRGTVDVSPTNPYARSLFAKRTNDPAGNLYPFPSVRMRKPEEFSDALIGAEVEFEPIIACEHPLAVDVQVIAAADIPADELYTGKGVLLTFSKDNSTAYIGDAFYTPVYNNLVNNRAPWPKGNIFISANLLPFEYDDSRIYAVEYTCAQQPEPGVRQRALSVALINAYPKTEYAFLKIMEDGAVHAGPNATAYLPLFARPEYQSRKADMDVTLKDGSVASGIASDFREDSLILTANGEERALPAADIQDVRYYCHINAMMTGEPRNQAEPADEANPGLAEPAGKYRGKGIILNGSYIGNTFHEPTYHTLMYGNADKPTGHILFTADQIGFPRSPSEIYVVEYTCAARPVPGKVQKALSVELAEHYSKEEYAYIHVDEGGAVHAEPVLTAYLPLFARDEYKQKNIEIDVRLKDGSRKHGYAADFQNGALILNHGAGSASIPTGEIGDIRYFSSVSYIQSGLARTNSISTSIAVHVNEVADPAEQAMLNAFNPKQPCLLSYRLAWSPKGLMGVDAHVYQVEQFDGYLCGYDETGAVIVHQNDRIAPGGRIVCPQVQLAPAASRAISHAQASGQPFNFYTNDYPAYFSLRTRHSETILCIIRITTTGYGVLKKQNHYGSLVGFNGESCIIAAGPEGKRCVYPVLYANPAVHKQLASYEGEARNVSFSLGNRQGVDGVCLMAINSFQSNTAQLETGYLTEYSGDLCRIIPESEYNTASHGKQPAAPILFIDPKAAGQLKSLDLTQTDYQVRYTEAERSGMAGVCLLSVGAGRPKPRYGYVVAFMKKDPEKRGTWYGFVTDEEDLAAKLRRPNEKFPSDKYFRMIQQVPPDKRWVNVVRGIDPDDIHMGSTYYRVSYLQNAGTITEVNFLEAIAKHSERISVAPAAPAPQPVEITPVEQTLCLSALPEEGRSSFDGAEVSYGLVNVAGNYISIHPFYFNKTLNKDKEAPEGKLLASFMAGSFKDAFNTKKYSYLVRFVQKGFITDIRTGDELPSVDPDYPVETLYTIQKDRCLSVFPDPENDRVTITWNGMPPSPEGCRLPEYEEDEAVNYEPLELTEGESVLLELTDGRKLFDSYLGQTDGAWQLHESGEIAKETVKTFYRFGMAENLFNSPGTAIINGSVAFNLGVMDPASRQMLANERNIQLHVIYACGDNRMISVRRLNEEEKKLIRWVSGFVTECSHESRQIVMDGGIWHCLSSGTDPMVYSMYRDSSIKGQSVLMRRIRHVYKDEEMPISELKYFAVDVRCAMQELTVRYDVSRGSYRGEYNPNISYPLLAPPSVLHPLEGSRAAIVLQPDSTNGRELFGYLEGRTYAEENSETEEAVGQSDENYYTEFTRLILNQAVLKRYPLNVPTDEDGYPADCAAAEAALNGPLNGRSDEDTLIARVQIARKWEEARLPAGQNGRPPKRDAWIRSQLRLLYEHRCDRILRLPETSCAEASAYLTELLRFAPNASNTLGRNRQRRAYTKQDCLYRLFLMDFASPEQLRRFNQFGDRPAGMETLEQMLSSQAAPNSMQNFAAHLIMISPAYLSSVSGSIESNEKLSAALAGYANEIDPALKAGSVADLIIRLGTIFTRQSLEYPQGYQLDLRDLTVKAAADRMADLGNTYFALMCEEDAHRYVRLQELTQRLTKYAGKPGFSAQDEELREIYRGLSELQSEILEHPGRSSLELANSFKESSLLGSLTDTTAVRLNALYRNISPHLHLTPNTTTLARGAKVMYFLFSNEDPNHGYCKTVTNLSLSVRPLTEGVQAFVESAPARLEDGETQETIIRIECPDAFTDNITLEWSARYQCVTAFEGGRPVTEWVAETGLADPFQLVDSSGLVKTATRADNPYRVAAEGNPLTESSGTRVSVYVDRVKEKRDILETFTRGEGAQRRFVPGGTVVLYGQKKCGKTSLANFIRSEVRENPQLNNQVIIVTLPDILFDLGGPSGLHQFKMLLFRKILLNFKNEISKNHPDVKAMMEENDLSIPTLGKFMKMADFDVEAFFDDYFYQFAELDQGRHIILLIMDEFTRLCTTIADIVKHAPDGSLEKQYVQIPTFVRSFSQEKGFVQLIIGHENMMTAIDKLSISNHITEFAKCIEMREFAPEEAEELIIRPMTEALGYNPYNSTLGRRAVERLKDLSGCLPRFLTSWCSDMFDYYVDPEKCPHMDLTERDVETVLKERLQKTTLAEFDSLFFEDGDEVKSSDLQATYKFLRAAAKCSIDANSRMADENKIQSELKWTDSDYKATRDLLVRRHVISLEGHGQLRIANGLFIEYIRKNMN